MKQTTVLLAIGLGGLTLAACAGAPRQTLPPAPASAASPSPAKPAQRPALPSARPQAAPGARSDAILYRCAGGKRFTAAWGLEGDKVQVNAGGVSRTLPHLPSASGARYGDGTYQIWGKGEAAMLEGFPGGPYTSCVAG
ncbi:hypothetical protein GVN21_13780 [Caulobacter sp. SLTY]|uniref:MliC family protein n=1 Tax=Caulobacter sp. SLTY TaxID=2683262 RepID=UPI0014131AD9|nr:hypothetical protein [Caulobacter sp. SLTY]